MTDLRRQLDEKEASSSKSGSIDSVKAQLAEQEKANSELKQELETLKSSEQKRVREVKKEMEETMHKRIIENENQMIGRIGELEKANRTLTQENSELKAKNLMQTF
mmetsp:Transcript_10598/g.17807  ORF Transcript_10598/g.17807 Transcript_10598/m.17807 type:complete len:106 (+) Transcript_10598:275-592(+)|eukprot:CAMPEP_0168611718 /NCGR_PEP_ID=MMETSP0449_2-20121227/2508_1 /TAXON_ID=1082188 /ORGANISM="Strombidium rassoulzadegani, Strain ras09" /LENGTH=105 /DNA_ID=CAMNT_0008652185 /DNA_START=264 /DNA_END=581 /DNA_ORIENTATION=-